ncbi:MAG: 50S ribosomal protein L37ae [Thermoplasmata archaeon]|nr:50S ribosomal protein L37ae [Thermoplasmata archaeon]
MSRRTKKVGSAGRLGPRYGVRVRYRLKAIDSTLRQRHPCPRCHHVSVRRHKAGIWKCCHCGYTFAAGAYSPKTRGFGRIAESGAEGGEV